DVLAGGERGARVLPQQLPFPPRAVGADRLLEPGEIVLGEGRRKLGGALDGPTLIDIGREHAVACKLTQRGEVGAIGGGFKADLQLERAMAAAHGRFRHLPRARWIDATGIDPDSAAPAAEAFPQRQVTSSCLKIPERQIDAGDGLRERPGFPGLQREHGTVLRELLKNFLGLAYGPDRRWRQNFIDQPRAVLGTGGGEIAPGFAPAGNAVLVLDAHEYRRPVGHPAKGRDDRSRQRIAVAKRLELANLCWRRSHFVRIPGASAARRRLLYGHPIYNMTSATSTRNASWKRRMSGSVVRRFLLGLAPWVGAVLLWYAVRWSGFVSDALIPAPHQVAAKFIDLLLHDTLALDIVASTRRVFLGVVLGILVAVPVGFMLGWYRPARTLADPMINFFRALPPIALIPLVIVYFGVDEIAKLVILFYASFFSGVIVMYEGVSQITPLYIRVAQTLG